jgi:uncharacterized protein (TIGR03437 family)
VPQQCGLLVIGLIALLIYVKRLTSIAVAMLLLGVAGMAQVITGVGNGANFQEPIASHSVAVVVGSGLAATTCSAGSAPLPRVLCGVRVVISAGSDSVDAPLYFVSPTQINFQVPISLGTLTLCVGTACTQIVVDLQAPAIFEFAFTPGNVIPIITHLDGSLVTQQNPARNGEFVVVWATGMGLDFNTLRFPGDGEPAPGNPPVEFATRAPIRVGDETQFFGGERPPVSFQGLSPGSVGLAQFNVKVERETCTIFSNPTPEECRFPSGPLPIWIEGLLQSKKVVLWIE